MIRIDILKCHWCHNKDKLNNGEAESFSFIFEISIFISRNYLLHDCQKIFDVDLINLKKSKSFTSLSNLFSQVDQYARTLVMNSHLYPYIGLRFFMDRKYKMKASQ